MSKSTGSVTRICLILFGAYLAASGVEVVLHESGHGIAALLLGADIESFVVHPFRRSEVAISYDHGRRAESSLLFSAAGILFAVGVSAVGFLATPRGWHYFLAVRFLLPVALLAEGSYLIDGSLNDYGDPSAIASLAYLPQGALVVLGGTLVMAGLLIVLRLMADVGLDKSVPWWARTAAFLALAVTAMPGAMYMAEAGDSWPKVLTLTALGLFMLVFALSAGLFVHVLRRRLSWFLRVPASPVSWTHVAVSILAAVITIGLMLGFGTHG